MSQFSCYDHYLYLHQIIIIFIIIINFTIVSDLVPILEATVEVRDWYILGLALGISGFVLERIQYEDYNRIDCKRKMLLKWLYTGLASWSSLVKALIRSPLVNEMVIAEQISKDHPNSSSKYDTYNVCINNDYYIIVKYVLGSMKFHF